MRTVRTLSLLFLVIASVVVILGCGSTDGGLSDWQKPAPVTIVSNIKGKILPPVAAGALRGQFSLFSAQGTRVFVEEKPEFYADADDDGNFIIKNVPVGRYRLVAYKTSGTTPYRQRSDLINLTGQFETQVFETPLTLEYAPYTVKVSVSDVISGAMLNARVRVWGFEFLTLNGTAEIGPFPGGSQSKEVRIEAVGYLGSTFLVGFSDQKQAQLFVKLTPATSTTGNRAPFVEIDQAKTLVKTNETLGLSASGIDPDGDVINWSWSVTAGGLTNQTGATTVFTAPSASGSVEVTLTGRDKDGAEGKATLLLTIEQGNAPEPNPYNRSPVAAASPVPENFSENISDDAVLRWVGSDPDGDALNYDVIFAAQGDEMTVVAEGLTVAAWTASGLKPFTTYFWRVVSRDPYEATSVSPTWQFKTGDLDNFAPYIPALPIPEDLSINQLPSTLCSWSGGDPNAEDIVTYSFMLGTDQNDLQLKDKTRQTTMQLESLELETTYYWQIISADNRGKETTGPLWRFSTHAPVNRRPDTPVAISPASGTAGVAVSSQLRWSASDPDEDAMTFDVFLGSDFPLAKVAADRPETYFQPAANLKYNTSYFWQIVARDSRGLTNLESPVWSFSTVQLANQPPNQPIAVSPASGSVGVTNRPVFAWSGGDIDDDTVYYDFYLDTVAPPLAKIAERITATTHATTQDLTAGRTYYWQVVAEDSSGSRSASSIYSFTVISSETDQTPPEILSVTPANGETDVADTAAVRIVFSEPLKPASIAAFSFVPAVGGAWTWENSSTARYTPSPAWLPGSYNRLSIADNVVEDINGKKMERGAAYNFTVNSAIPVPSGCRSTAFPLLAKKAEVTNVSVPGLPNGAKSYALAVSAGSPASFTVRANSRSVIPEGVDAHSAFRFFENEITAPLPAMVLQGREDLRANILPQPSVEVGEIQEFFIPVYGQIATSTPYPNNKIQARCVAIGDEAIIFVDTAVQLPSSSLIADVHQRITESIKPTVNEMFGDEPEFGPDGENRLTVLLTDSMTLGILGIFYGVDLFNPDANNLQLRESNGRKILYVRYTQPSSVMRFGTIAHEFQHMVNFFQKQRLGGNGNYETVWLNEGLSKFAEEVCGFGISAGDSNTVSLIRLSQQNMQNLSLTSFAGVNSYGLSYLFVKFLAEENRYGTTYREITRKLVNSSLTGKNNVAAVTGESFEHTLAKWGLSIYLNRYNAQNAQDYGIKNLNLAGSYNGVSLPGFAFADAANGPEIDLKPDGLRGIVKTSTGEATTNFSLESVSGDVNLWLFDNRP